MRVYCKEAALYGEERISVQTPLKRVLVLLNPAANKKGSEELFSDYTAPILNLAGFIVEVVKTESEGHAIRYIEEELKVLPDAIIVAGGDGTLAEIITGLVRRQNGSTVPVGVLPIGQINAFSSQLYSSNKIPSSKVEKIRCMTDSALAIVKGNTVSKDIMKIEVIDEDETGQELIRKPIYAVTNLQWGGFRDVFAKREKYWYTGSLRNYTAFLFNGFGSFECKTKLIYSETCGGCSNCHEKSETVKVQSRKWWARFVPKLGVQQKVAIDYSKVINENCAKTIEMDFNAKEVIISTDNLISAESLGEKPKLKIQLAKPNDSSVDFIMEGWKRISNREYYNVPEPQAVIEARTVTLIPEKNETDKEAFYSIDNEEYDVKSVKISLMPSKINFFTL